MADSAVDTELGRVVDLNEHAKAIFTDSHQVNLRALDATVRSRRAGAQLRGFAEVAAQMRDWSRELQAAIERMSQLSAEQVQLVSGLVRQERLSTLLMAADCGSATKTGLPEAIERSAEELEAGRTGLKRFRRKLSNALEEIEQLGLMACVLSRAAAIEAASGSAVERQALTSVAQEFAERSEQVTDTIHAMVKQDRERR